MNLDALVKQGFPPWAPAPGVHTVDVWHEYDIPTAGILASEGGRSTLFTLVGDPEDRLTVWAYLSLTDEDAAALDRTQEQYESTEELDQALTGMFAGHGAVFALADNLRIWRWSPVDVESSVIEAGTTFLRGVRDSLAAKTDPGLTFRAELAGVEIQTEELVGA